jgi:hypothetical protein
MAVPISNVTRRQVYAPSGSGGVGPYAFTFEILANTDIAVFKDNTLLTLTTHYTVTINANGTGSVTITAAGLALSPTSPTQYAVVGNRTIARTSDFTTGGDFFANTINDELDQQTIFAQQNAEGLQRALQAPQTDPTTINMTLPAKASRALKTLSFDSDGNPTPGVSASDVANAVTYATNAANSATAAASSASSASSSASSASSSASTASTQASNASTSASNASTSASGASTSATNAAASASTASTQASNASTSATNAASSASAASTSASNASASASSAASAQTAAEAARDSALAAYDNFDDRYLGAKSSNPTVDNDGNTLLAGALYFNTVVPEMRLWTGSAWVAAYVSGSGFIAATGGTMTGPLNFPDGSAAAPSITNDGDTNTGIFFPAADTIAFAEGGVEAARFDSSGNFCLGTAAVLTSGKISLQANLSTANAMTIRDSGTTYGVSSYYTLYQNSAGSTVGGIGHTAVTSLGINAITDLQFFTASTERARIDSSGNVGIGNTTPSSYNAVADNLVIGTSGSNGLTIVAGTTNDGSIHFADGTSGADADRGQIFYSHAGNYMVFGTDAVERMRINSSGNVGIGTTSLTYKLEVNGAIRGKENIYVGRASDNAVIGAISEGTSSGFLITAAAGGSDSTIQFKTGGSERARIDSSGNLLVGTTSGTEKFCVTSSANASTAFFLNNNGTAANQYGIVVKLNGDPNNTNHMVQCLGGATERATIRANGGLANYSANNVNLSDARTKTDIQDAGGYLAKICAIPVRTFKYKDQTDDLLSLGCIAQEVEAVAPELVDVSGFGETPDDGVPLKAIYQTDLQYALMKCIQEQQALITQLTARITALEGA